MKLVSVVFLHLGRLTFWIHIRYEILLVWFLFRNVSFMYIILNFVPMNLAFNEDEEYDVGFVDGE